MLGRLAIDVWIYNILGVRVKYILLMASIFALVACSSVPQVKTDSQLYSSAANNSQSTQYGWYKVNESTLGFRGLIVSGSYDELLRLYQPGINTLIVNSGGGIVDDASKIGLLIHKNKLAVIVDGYCISSCANYFVTAASSVYLLNGLIGYHGNITSCVSIYGGIDKFLLKDELNPNSVNPTELSEAKKQTISTIENEKAFYDAIGLPPLYLSRSCRPDKGVGDGVTYAFISPPIDELKQHHVNVIGGTQSNDRKNEFENLFNAHVLVGRL